MATRLLEELERGQYDVAFFLTYTLNLRFFEQLVLPKLRRQGVGWIGILTDYKGYADSLDDPLSSDECGSAYAVGTPRTRLGGIQHAKVLWLQGREHAVYVGSHNLTVSGFNDQAELTTCLRSSEASHRAALRELHGAITPLVPESLLPVWARIHAPPDLKPENEPPSPTAARTVWALSSLGRPLCEQLKEIVGTSSDVRVVTPFLDAGALGRLAASVGAEAVELHVPSGGADTPLADVVALPLDVTLRRATGSRQLHAKAYEFVSPDSRWLALGSANCTAAALERAAMSGGNFEILVVARDAAVPDDGVVFELIDDPARYPGTGRRWDEEQGPRTPLAIERAEYVRGQLTLSWRLDWGREAPADAAARVLADGVEIGQVALASGAAEVAVSTAPRTAALEFILGDDQWQARAWVMVPDELEARAERRHLGRWRDLLAAADPLQHVGGGALCLEDMLRAFVRVREESTASGQAAWRSGARVSPQDVAAAVEVFQYSPDPHRIGQSVERFLEGPTVGDPLALLRALLARSAAVPPTEAQDDLAALAQHEQKRRLAQRRWGEALAHHFRRVATLLEPGPDQVSHAPDVIALVLAKTFGAAVLIWYFAVAQAEGTPGSQIAESFVSLLESLTKSSAAPLLRWPRVSGPLALCFGAIANPAAGDGFLTEKLRRLAHSVIGQDPRPLIDGWRIDPVGDALLLLSDARGRDLLAAWLPPTLLFFGIAPERTRLRQQQRWGVLLDLQRADMAARPDRAELYAACAELYSDSPVWTLYKGERSRGRFPALIAVREASCSVCWQPLPERDARAIKRGEAVVCPTGRHGLVFAT
ncbi:MAG: hypothetical protein ACR2NO_10065 [Chloroflexota bacterium]